MQVGERRELDGSATAHHQLGLDAGDFLELPVHAIDRTGDGVGAAAHQGVAGVGGEFDRLAGRRLQAGGAHLEGAQHEAETGQDQAAEKAAAGVERVHRDGGADHDHEHRLAGPRASTRWRAPISATQRSTPSRFGWS